MSIFGGYDSIILGLLGSVAFFTVGRTQKIEKNKRNFTMVALGFFVMFLAGVIQVVLK